jgi:hypothetical protein
MHFSFPQHSNPPIGFEVLTAVVMKVKITIYWNIAPCIPPKRRCIYRLHGAVAQKMVVFLFNPPVSTSVPTREYCEINGCSFWSHHSSFIIPCFNSKPRSESVMKCWNVGTKRLEVCNLYIISVSQSFAYLLLKP